MKKPCDICLDVERHGDVIRNPGHVVHPVRRVPRLYDVHCQAVCFQCGQVWRIAPGTNKAVMVRERKGPVRITSAARRNRA